MKLRTLLVATALFVAGCSTINKEGENAIYLDENQPIDERVEDALRRMTLREKIRILHAQSKFSSAGVPRLGIPELQCKLFSKKVNCAIFAIEREVKISSYAFEDIYCTTLQSKSDTDKAVINIIVESFISLNDQNKFFKNFIFNNDFQCYTYKKLYNIYKEFANEAIKRVVKSLDLPVRTYNLNKEFGKGLDAEETKLFNERTKFK